MEAIIAKEIELFLQVPYTLEEYLKRTTTWIQWQKTSNMRWRNKRISKTVELREPIKDQNNTHREMNAMQTAISPLRQIWIVKSTEIFKNLGRKHKSSLRMGTGWKQRLSHLKSHGMDSPQGRRILLSIQECRNGVWEAEHQNTKINTEGHHTMMKVSIH